jgi:hypothetical protein
VTPGEAWAVVLVPVVFALQMFVSRWLWKRALWRMVETVLERAIDGRLIERPTYDALVNAFDAYRKSNGKALGDVALAITMGKRIHTGGGTFLRGPRHSAALLLMLLAPAIALSQTEQPPAADQASLGGGMTAQEKVQAIPVVVIGVDFPVNLGADSSGTGRVYTQFGIDGAPGQTLDTGDVASFTALRFDIWLERVIGLDGFGGRTYIALHGGGAARLNTSSKEPFLRAPLWYSADFVFERRSGANFPHRRLVLGYGHSDLSSPPRRTPGTFAAAARDGVPRDLIVGGNVTVTALEDVGKDTKMKVCIGAYIHRALWGRTGTVAAVVTTTITFGKAS